MLGAPTITLGAPSNTLQRIISSLMIFMCNNKLYINNLITLLTIYQEKKYFSSLKGFVESDKRVEEEWRSDCNFIYYCVEPYNNNNMSCESYMLKHGFNN